MSRETISHREAWDLIPWFVNERASEDQCRRLTVHIANCTECRAELEEQRRLHRLIANDTRIDSVPGASLQKLWGRIDEQSATEYSESIEVPKKTGARLGRNRYLVGALAAAVTIEAIGLTLLGGMLWSQMPRTSATASTEYRTLSAPTTYSADANVRAVFAPDMTISELQTLLTQLDLQIVSGPSASGVYSLKTSRAEESADDAAARLRSQRGVRFAEPINIGSKHTP